MVGDAALGALHAVASFAAVRRPEDHYRLEQALGHPVDSKMLAALTTGLWGRRTTLNFHPDRLGPDRTSVAQGLLNTGRYLPQAVTGLSNGERSAVPGGRRMEWERKLFGAGYDQHPDPASRPIYGALDITHDPFGGSPRFGSSFLVLEAHCLDRTTLCLGDSHVGPTDLGTIDEPLGLLAGLFEQAAGGNALGRGIGTSALLDLLTNGEASASPGRELDHYVEAQVHGGVSLQTDVGSIVVDPSFHGTEVDRSLTEAARRYGFAVQWHDGSVLRAEDIPNNFRGTAVAELGRSLAANRLLDAATIGRSAATIPFTSPSMSGDAPASSLQRHKQLWHCLLALGQAAAEGTVKGPVVTRG